MSNSALISYQDLSHNHSWGREGHKISKITIHHMAGNMTVEQCGALFQGSRQVSSNYGIGSDGRIALYVEEKNRSWCTASRENDNVAVTIEVANDVVGGNWHVSDKAISSLIELCVDICKRNGIKQINFTGDKSGNLTMHKWFAATGCPGPYLESKFPYIAEVVNKRLVEPEDGNLYRVQVGAFHNKDYAEAYAKTLKQAGFDAFVTLAGDYDNDGKYTAADARAILKKSVNLE